MIIEFEATDSWAMDRYRGLVNCLNENIPHKIAGEIKLIRHFTLFNILIQVYSSLI